MLGVSTALYLCLVLVWHPAGFADVSVYRAEAQALSDGRDLYGPLPGVYGLATYPPFAAAAFTPLLLVPDAAVGLLSLVVNLALLLAASYLSLRRITARVDLGVAVPLLAAVALWCEPVMASNSFGQINLLLLCLVLWDFSLPEDSRWRGVGIGLAAALKVTPGIFIVYLLVTRRFRAALGAVATLLATLVVSAALAPSSTWGFWTHHVFDPSRVGRLENSLNQSVRGWIVRATHTLDTGALALVATAVVAVVGLAAAAYCYRRAGDGWGLLVAAFTGLLVSPISWSHHWVWCLPLLALAWYEARGPADPDPARVLVAHRLAGPARRPRRARPRPGLDRDVRLVRRLRGRVRGYRRRRGADHETSALSGETGDSASDWSFGRTFVRAVPDSSAREDRTRERSE